MKLDTKGNLFIADYDNNVVRKVVLSTGIITTVAGNGDDTYSGDGGPATQAGMDPYDIAVDTSGNLYIADYLNSRIRKVTAATGIISTLAGSTVPGFGGDNGPANQAVLDGPIGISVDANGAVYFVDYYNDRVRKIDQTANKITTFAGTGQGGYGEPSYDGDGGLATAAYLALPYSTAVEPDGNILIDCIVELWRVTVADGTIHFLAGSDSLAFGGDGGSASAAKFGGMIYAGSAPNDDILIADVGNFRVRRIHAGVVNTVAGTTIADNIPATSAFLNLPDGIVPDGKGGLLISDTGDSRIRDVSNGTITAYHGTGIRGTDAGELFFPSGVTTDSQGALYIADTENDRVVRLIPGGAATVIAGGNGDGFGGDGGYGPRATLSSPTGVAIDTAGNIYIADSGNFRIRKLDTNLDISTIAGTGFPGDTGDGAAATKARIALNDVTFNNGSLYLTDPLFNVVRKIDLSTGLISTVAGVGSQGYTGDNGPATSAQLKVPLSVAFDAAGSMYIADNGNSVVRKVTGGIIHTVAGNGGFSFNTETGTALGVSIDPTRIAIDSSGAIYITDNFNDRIRKLTVQVPTMMSIQAGNNQSAPAGSVVSISVKVTDASGMPVGNALVNFTVTAGTAVIGLSGVLTGADGVATAQLTLGQTPGPLSISAASAGINGVSFSLTILTPAAPSPMITSDGVQGAALSVPPVQALSTGGIATVFGTNFASNTTFQSVAAGDLVNGQTPVNFLGVCVLVAGTRAPIFGASSTQVNFQTPLLGSAASASVQVVTGCDSATPLNSNTLNVPAQNATPEFFHFANNTNGNNPVAATDSISGAYLVAASRFPGSGFTPAYPGEYVTIYGTGFGATNPSFAPGVFPTQGASLVGTVTVTLGGNALPAADILYAGVTPNSPGLYQLNLQIPADAASGDLPLVINIGGASSPVGAYLTVQSQ